MTIQYVAQILTAISGNINSFPVPKRFNADILYAINPRNLEHLALTLSLLTKLTNSVSSRKNIVDWWASV